MAPTMPHVSGPRAIRIPLHGHLDTTKYPPSSRSRRPAGPQHSKTDRTGSSDHGTSSSVGSDSWTHSPASPSDVTHQKAAHVQHSVASPTNTTHTSMPSSGRQRKDKQRATPDDIPPPNTLAPTFQTAQSPLGPSMLSSSSYKSVNLNAHIGGDSEEPARLITYTKHSQGFTWNDELFLPSYMVGRHRHGGGRGGGGSRRYRPGGMWNDDDDDGIFDEDGDRCPVTDIFVTDEEAEAMMP